MIIVHLMHAKEPLDLTGMKFGRLTAIKEGARRNNRRYWECLCDCGKRTSKMHWPLKMGKVRSCGCLVPDSRYTTHGLSRTKIGKVWEAMKSRCLNPNRHAFNSYGGRGIKICRFILEGPHRLKELIGDRPGGLTMDRIKNDKGYTCGKCPECKRRGWELNIRWATKQQQNRNTRVNRLVKIGGVTKCVTEWAESTGLHKETISSRLLRGWSGKRLLSTPQNFGKRAMANLSK